MKKILSALLLACLLIGCLSSCAGKTAPDGFQLVSMEDDIFCLYVPKSWADNRSSGMASAYASLEKNVIVTAETIDAEGSSLEDFVKRSENSYAQMDDYELISSVDTKVADCDAHILAFDGSVKNTDGESRIYRIKVYLIKKDDNFAILTYSSPKEFYNEYIGVLDLIIGYFSFREGIEPSSEKNDEDVPAGYQLASDDKYEYSLYVPDSWIVSRGGYNPTAYFSESDRSNVSMTVTFVDEALGGAYEYVSSYWESFKIQSPDGSIIGDPVIKNDKMGKYDAYSIEYAYSINGSDYMIKQAFLPVSGSIYIFTYTSDTENYADHLDEVNKMIEMFEFK